MKILIAKQNYFEFFRIPSNKNYFNALQKRKTQSLNIIKTKPLLVSSRYGNYYSFI